MKKKTYKYRYRILQLMVRTTRRPAAQMPLNSFERQVLQLWLPARVGFRHRYRRIERLLTTIPNLSSSPRMRSVSQSRFSWEDPGDEIPNLAAESRAAESGA
jgi:hypothetical protein